MEASYVPLAVLLQRREERLWYSRTISVASATSPAAGGDADLLPDDPRQPRQSARMVVDEGALRWPASCHISALEITRPQCSQRIRGLPRA